MHIYNMYIYMVRMYIYNENTEDNVPSLLLQFRQLLDVPLT